MAIASTLIPDDDVHRLEAVFGPIPIPRTGGPMEIA